MAMDQQASMDYLRDLYREKNEHLEKFLEPVTPFEFYREIFPVGSFERKGHFEDEKGNGIAVTVPKTAGIALGIEGDGKARRYTITDELSELSEVFDTDFTIMGGGERLRAEGGKGRAKERPLRGLKEKVTSPFPPSLRLWK